MSTETKSAKGIAPLEKSDRSIDPGVNIGHVHLKTADIDRVHHFYVDLLGFDVVWRHPSALFISAGGYHHHLGFNTWESKGGSPPPPGTTGLYHVAIRYPTRAGLGDALRRLRDAEENGLELCWDRPKEEWDRDANGHYALGNRRLDLAGLLRAGLDESS